MKYGVRNIRTFKNPIFFMRFNTANVTCTIHLRYTIGHAIALKFCPLMMLLPTPSSFHNVHEPPTSNCVVEKNLIFSCLCWMLMLHDIIWQKHNQNLNLASNLIHTTYYVSKLCFMWLMHLLMSTFVWHEFFFLRFECLNQTKWNFDAISPMTLCVFINWNVQNVHSKNDCICWAYYVIFILPY